MFYYGDLQCDGIVKSTQKRCINKAYYTCEDKLLCGMHSKYNKIGYDGYYIDKTLYEHYVDTSKPFGHELVLYTMLVEDDKDKYPWNIFYKKNEEIYKNVI